MKKNLLLYLCILSSFPIYGINNSIVFYSNSGVNCEFIFRDTAGTRTYTPTSFSWDFGDGNYSNTQHAIHDYLVNGSYIVKHYCNDGVNFDTAIITVAVGCKANNALASYFYIERSDTLNPEVTKFRSFIDGRPTGLLWDFGDGNISYNVHPSHIYSSHLHTTYTVCLTIWDNNDTDKFCQPYFHDPFYFCKNSKANFYWEHDTVCNGVKFINLSGSAITSQFWDFGDGNWSNLTDPKHPYISTIKQSYIVSLKVWDTVGCSDSFSMLVYPKCRTCYSVIADIKLTTDSLNPSKAILYNNSTGPINSHFWDFGDGNTSTQSSPVHTYTSPGQITLRYIATDTFNCADTAYLYFEIDTNGHIKRSNFSFTLQVINNTNYTSLKQVYIGQPSLHIYPQPADKHVFIETSDVNVYQLTVYNSNGQIIETLNPDTEGKTELNTSTWQPGLYLIKDNLGRTMRLMVLH